MILFLIGAILLSFGIWQYARKSSQPAASKNKFQTMLQAMSIRTGAIIIALGVIAALPTK